MDLNHQTGSRCYLLLQLVAMETKGAPGEFLFIPPPPLPQAERERSKTTRRREIQVRVTEENLEEERKEG